jgi:hypothetical protein
MLFSRCGVAGVDGHRRILSIKMLFDNHVRCDSSLATTEGAFEFLDRAASPYWDAIRDALNTWLSHYPADDRGKLRKHLCDDETFGSAFWELLLHEFYTAAGYAVEVHPPLDDSERRPDFIIADDETAFLLEARVVTGTSDERRRRNRRLSTVVEAINRTRPGNLYVKMDIVAEGRDQPGVGPIVAELDPWLARLDPGDVANTLRSTGSFEALPSREIGSGGWLLRFTPIPVDPGISTLTGPLIGIGPIETSRSDPTAAVRKALGKKGRRYGTTQLPLVVALAVEELGVETGDVAAALFGKVATLMSGNGEPVVVGHRRLDDGYWSGWRNAGQRVAGVLTVATPRPWNVATLEPRLWLNPWSPVQYGGRRIWQWTTVDAETGEFREGPAETAVANLLSLPPDWPPGLPFTDKHPRDRAN